MGHCLCSWHNTAQNNIFTWLRVGRGLLSLLGLGAEGRLGHVVWDCGEGGPLEDELRGTRPAKTQFKSFYAVQSVI